MSSEVLISSTIFLSYGLGASRMGCLGLSVCLSVGLSVCRSVKKMSKIVKKCQKSLKQKDFDVELETKDVSLVEQTLNFIYRYIDLFVCWSVRKRYSRHIFLTIQTRSLMLDFSRSCYYKFLQLQIFFQLQISLTSNYFNFKFLQLQLSSI